MKFDMQNILSQAKKMQDEMEKIKIETSNKIVEAESGAGLVKVHMKCNYEILSLKISKEAIDFNDIEMLEDLVVAAVNKAVEKANNLIQGDMSKLSSMMPNIPGMNLGF